MPFSKLNIKGVHKFDDPIFFLSRYFECRQADIEWILNKVSKNYYFQISRPGEEGEEGFHIRFSKVSETTSIG